MFTKKTHACEGLVQALEGGRRHLPRAQRRRQVVQQRTAQRLPPRPPARVPTPSREQGIMILMRTLCRRYVTPLVHCSRELRNTLGKL